MKNIPSEKLAELRRLEAEIAIAQARVEVLSATLREAALLAVLDVGGRPGDHIDEETGEVRPRPKP